MERRHLKFYEIIDGHWSSAGNFLGETANGEIIHIFKKQLELLGYYAIIDDPFDEKLTVINEIKFPIFALAYNKQFINEKGKNVTRLTASSIWNSYSLLINALLEDIELKNLG
jgi:hypothetical protein